jgi:hypothetical protein
LWGSKYSNGHLLISNSDEFNPNPQEPSAIDEYTVGGQFIGQIFVDPNQGGSKKPGA